MSEEVMINLKINDIPVSVPKGTKVIEAAKKSASTSPISATIRISR